MAGGHRGIIFGFLSQNLKTMAVAVAFSMAWAEGWAEGGTGPGPAGRDLALGRLAGFRRELCECLGKRADVLFEACDAMLCRQERVHMLAELTLEPECRRPAVTANAGTARYGSAEASAWPRMHQRLGRQPKWKGRPPRPAALIEGTLIRLAVDRLPGDRSPEPLWLWTTSASAAASAGALNRAWQAFLRRFDIAHVPVLQAAARLDPPEAPRPGRRRPLDLARRHLLRPAVPGPPPRR